jgi:glutathione S-transferase
MDVAFEIQMLKPFADAALVEQLRSAGLDHGKTLPILAHGDFHIFESSAIASYLTRLYNKLGGVNEQEHALCLQWQVRFPRFCVSFSVVRRH